MNSRVTRSKRSCLIPFEKIEQILRQHATANVQSQTAIAFPLSLIEELIGSRLLRKGGMGPVILFHVRRLVADERGLHVNQPRGFVVVRILHARQSRVRAGYAVAIDLDG